VSSGAGPLDKERQNTSSCKMFKLSAGSLHQPSLQAANIASGGSDGKVLIWSEPGEGGEWARVQVLEDHTSYIRGKQLATGSWDNLINLYSFNEGSAILAHTLEGHTGFVYSLVRLQAPLLGK